MESLPSVLFGISPKIYTDRSVQNAARFIPLERMILETDSPYLAASPAETVDVAREVAKLKALSIEDVLRSTSMNAARLYEHYLFWGFFFVFFNHYFPVQTITFQK